MKIYPAENKTKPFCKMYIILPKINNNCVLVVCWNYVKRYKM